jgi:broad specificity phosphatase PhoE
MLQHAPERQSGRSGEEARILPQVYLIRHGRPASTWGDPDPDPGLDAEGEAQAQAAAAALLALPVELRPVRVVSSPLRRCRETAAPLARALGVEIEIVPEVGEIPTPAALAAEARPAWLRSAFEGRWSDIVGDIDYEAWRRAVHGAVVNRPGAAVFSHFVAINAVVSILQGSDAVIGFRPDHASVTILEVEGDGACLVRQGAEASTRVL